MNVTRELAENLAEQVEHGEVLSYSAQLVLASYVHQVLDVIDQMNRYAGFLQSCVRTGESTEMTIRQFAERETEKCHSRSSIGNPASPSIR